MNARNILAILIRFFPDVIVEREADRIRARYVREHLHRVSDAALEAEYLRRESAKVKD
jgi:hypothetical protein